MAAVVLFGAGMATGSATVDPTASEEYRALVGERTSAAGERDAVGTKYDELVGDYNSLVSGMEEREAGLDERETDIEERESALETREGELRSVEAAVAKREKAVTGAEEEKATNAIGNGTWTVGMDIAAGTYRTDSPVDSDCYWAILRTGTNGDIEENDIPGGGRPSVRLSEGQDFKSNRCGTWTKR
ncbi:hypothetical protein ACX8Z9_04760 [Arthrobacter halodurans]